MKVKMTKQKAYEIFSKTVEILSLFVTLMGWFIQ